MNRFDELGLRSLSVNELSVNGQSSGANWSDLSRPRSRTAAARKWKLSELIESIIRYICVRSLPSGSAEPDSLVARPCIETAPSPANRPFARRPSARPFRLVTAGAPFSCGGRAVDRGSITRYCREEAGRRPSGIGQSRRRGPHYPVVTVADGPSRRERHGRQRDGGRVRQNEIELARRIVNARSGQVGSRHGRETSGRSRIDIFLMDIWFYQRERTFNLGEIWARSSG